MYAQIAAFLLGCWLTAAPQLLGYSHPARGNDHIVGPLAATAALTAVFQATRPLRWLNLPLGGWLLLAPWVLGYAGPAEQTNSMLVGTGLVVLACVWGTTPERLGGGWSAVWRPAGGAA